MKSESYPLFKLEKEVQKENSLNNVWLAYITWLKSFTPSTYFTIYEFQGSGSEKNNCFC